MVNPIKNLAVFQLVLYYLNEGSSARKGDYLAKVYILNFGYRTKMYNNFSSNPIGGIQEKLKRTNLRKQLSKLMINTMGKTTTK